MINGRSHLIRDKLLGKCGKTKQPSPLVLMMTNEEGGPTIFVYREMLMTIIVICYSVEWVPSQNGEFFD